LTLQEKRDNFILQPINFTCAELVSVLKRNFIFAL